MATILSIILLCLQAQTDYQLQLAEEIVSSLDAGDLNQAELTALELSEELIP